MTGAGNDFILIDDRTEEYQLSWPSIAPQLCNRRYGVGADGLLIMRPSSRAEFTMEYYNADGSFGGMCGNGGRCVARYAMEMQRTKKVSFEALGNIHEASIVDNEICLGMMSPKSSPHTMNLHILGKNTSIHFIDAGAPHAVIFQDELDPKLALLARGDGFPDLGRSVRLHTAFGPNGTNVDVIHTHPNHSISIRTYERGVEEETLACGTGAVASAIIASLHRQFKPPISIITHSREVLTVRFRRIHNQFSEVTLRGEATFVFRGQFDLTSNVKRVDFR